MTMTCSRMSASGRMNNDDSAAGGAGPGHSVMADAALGAGGGPRRGTLVARLAGGGSAGAGAGGPGVSGVRFPARYAGVGGGLSHAAAGGPGTGGRATAAGAG